MDSSSLTVISGLIGAVLSALAGAVGALYRKVVALQKSEAKCQARLAAMEAELVSVNALMEQMRWSGQSEFGGLIVANALTGCVVEWNPGATILLHFTAREMLGKSITKIMPARYRDRHLKALDAVRAGARVPRRGPFDFHAMTKEGTEIPVRLVLSGWTVGDERFVAATVNRRNEGEGEQAESQESP